MDCQPTSTGSLPKPPQPPDGRRVPVVLMLAALATGAVAQPLPLAPDKAFRFDARALSPQSIEARFSIVDGYYLYRDRIHFSVEPVSVPATVSALPPGKTKDDPFFGKVETYRGQVIVNIALKGTVPGQKVIVVAESQGCADVGICYPVQMQRVTVSLPAANVAPTRPDATPRKLWFE